MEEKLDIVFISSDEDQADFDAYFKEMPWKALPFSGMRNIFKVYNDQILFRSRSFEIIA